MLLYAGGAINGGSSKTDIPPVVKPLYFYRITSDFYVRADEYRTSEHREYGLELLFRFHNACRVFRYVSRRR